MCPRENEDRGCLFSFCLRLESLSPKNTRNTKIRSLFCFSQQPSKYIIATQIQLIEKLAFMLFLGIIIPTVEYEDSIFTQLSLGFVRTFILFFNLKNLNSSELRYYYNIKREKAMLSSDSRICLTPASAMNWFSFTYCSILILAVMSAIVIASNTY